jgi:hypothetical protein
MGDTGGYAPPEHVKFAKLSDNRLYLLMGGLLLAGIVWGIVYADSQVVFGWYLGGVGAFLNYYWLRRSLKSFFDRVINQGATQLISFGYFQRYVFIGLAIAMIYLFKLASIVALVCALLIMPAAIIIESFIVSVKQEES